jgi:murein DD-endopeptidase MepM/ murein hydrolase activator NlpD
LNRTLKAEKEAEEQKNNSSKSTQTTKNGSNINGVVLSTAPVSGRISSRYGVNESIRNHTHKGLDIAAPNGTSIVAAADGVVTYAQYNSGGYGNLVKISHGNGVETYYAHCSKLYVSVGQTVSAGDTIAAVGSTGNSTGNHLHFEIRKNGTQINPQKYLYK